MFKVETWECALEALFCLTMLVDYCNVRETGKNKERQRRTDRWRNQSRQSSRDREGPILSDTDYGLFFLGGPEKMQCKWSVLHHGGFCFILALCVCAYVCVKGKWQRPLWVLRGLCSPSVLSWLEYVGRTAIPCPRPISKDNRRIYATQMRTWINTNASNCVVETSCHHTESILGNRMSLSNNPSVCQIVLLEPHHNYLLSSLYFHLI